MPNCAVPISFANAAVRDAGGPPALPLSAGMNEYLAKPVKKADLLRMVERFGHSECDLVATVVGVVTAAPIRVVVADDEPGLRRELVAVLLEQGVDVVGEAADGQLRRPRRNVAPRGCVDGSPHARDERHRGDPHHSPAPQPPAVVLLSAYDDAALKECAADVGAFDYLVKGCRGRVRVRRSSSRAADVARQAIGTGA